MAKRIHRLITLLTVAALALSCSGLALADESETEFDPEEHSRQSDDLQKEASDLQKSLDKTEKSIARKQKQSQQLQEQITELNTQIKTSNETIHTLNDEITALQVPIDQKLQELEDILTLLQKRLRAVHTAGDTTSLEIILGAKSFSDFVDKSEMIRSMSEYDQRLIDNVKTQLQSIADEQKALQKKKALVEQEKSDLETKKQKINELMDENTRLIEELTTEEDRLNAELEANEEKQKELDKALADYQKKQAAKSGSEIVVTPNADGSWVWPCPGFTYLTSSFEEWRGTNNHGALDIADAGIYGAKVVAACNGVVFSTNETCTHDFGKSSSCGCGGGYGNYVMIDHGDGKLSIYAHLSGVTVTPGQSVSAGQLIGYVGSTGYSTGAHLHFETRYNGVRYDPLTEY